MDLDQSTFSPPEHDDTFLYIRHPRQLQTGQNPQDPPNKYSPITDLLERNRLTTDYTNHTKPCQQYINGASVPAQAPTQIKILKSNGVDDGFKGDGAACGTSVVRVAHQMIVSRGFNLPPSASSIPEDDIPATPPVGWDPSRRRGSRSAPSSPVSQRKLNSNKYFTGAFTDGAVEKYQGSWILSGLLGKRENMSKSVNTLTEEDSVDTELTEKKKTTSGQLFRAKPSELREMNFWSPTSM